MKRIIYIVLVWQIFTALVWGGSVQAIVKDTNVVEGNSVSLVLKATGADVKFPTLHEIGGYPIEGVSNRSQSSIKVLNGSMTQESIKKQTLSFTPSKAMTIPSFTIEVDGESLKTEPIDIKIVKAKAGIPRNQQKVSLEMVVSKKSAYVGEPILLSVFFNESNKADLMKVEYRKPETKDFFVKDLGGEKTYRKGNYLVHELRYILTPKYEGNMTISPARAKIAERGRRKDDFFGTFFDTPIWSRVVSNSLNISVKTSPEDTDLIGDFTLSDTVDATEVKANKPVNLTIKISGEGNLEDFVGPTYEIDGVTIYSDDAIVKSQPLGDRLVSSYEKKFVFIADHNFTIPSRSFSLFDFKTGKVKILETKSHRITVKGGKGITPVVIQSAQPSSIAPKRVEEAEVQKIASLNGSNQSDNLAPWMLLLAFGSGVLSILGIIKFLPTLKWKRATNPMKESEAIKILYPHISDDSKVEDMVRKLYAKKGGDKSIVIDKVGLRVLVDRYRV